MDKQKHRRFFDAILNFILEACVAKAMRISPLEAASLLKPPDAAGGRSVAEAHHGR